jgi:uncharacterized protein
VGRPALSAHRPPLPEFLHVLIERLRRRGIPIGVDDCQALRLALAAGLGWESSSRLRELCVMLWAKSAAEAETVRAVFAGAAAPEWTVPTAPDAAPREPHNARGGDGPPPDGATPAAADASAGSTSVRAVSGLAPPPDSGDLDPSLLLVAHYPLSGRAVAQIWRRLRRPIRHGPAVALDVAATIHRRARTGVACPPVLVPAQRNAARLVMLVDRGGSMAPYHGYVDHICAAIRHATRLDVLRIGYFHDVPGHGDRSLLADADPRTANVDRLLPRIGPLARGRIYGRPDLTGPHPIADVLDGLTTRTAVTVISDAGAARGSLDPSRLLDTVALLKAVRASGAPVVWLNPASRTRWARTTAALVARHVPMFALDRVGMYRAVDALRGRHVPVELPL